MGREVGSTTCGALRGSLLLALHGRCADGELGWCGLHGATSLCWATCPKLFAAMVRLDCVEEKTATRQVAHCPTAEQVC